MSVAVLCGAIATCGTSLTSAQVPASAPLPGQTEVLPLMIVELTVLSGGKCTVDSHTLNCSDLSGYFRTINAQHRCRLRVHVDSSVPYADLAAALKAMSDGGGCRIGYTNVRELP
jgi:hypothetical protein